MIGGAWGANETGRWPAPPLRVEYYTVESGADQWIVVATVHNVDDTAPLSSQALVVGAAASRDGAIGDMVRRMTRVVTPIAAD